MYFYFVDSEELPDAGHDHHDQGDDQDDECTSVEYAVCGRPAKPLMLSAHNALHEEPIDHEEDDRANVYKHICSYTKPHVRGVTRPCYP